MQGNTLKKIIAGALACTTAAASGLALAGCGSSSSDWAIKSSTATISSGVYRYCLLYAYNNAMYSVEDYTQPILTQTIDGQTGEEWIKSTALTYVIPFLVVDEKMAEMKLSLDDTTRYNAEQSAASDWESYGSMLSEYGITQSDYEYATYDYSAKYTAVFEAIYGKGGTQEVSYDDMKAYVLANYTDVSYLLLDTSSMDEAAVAALQAQLDQDAAAINAGSTNLQAVATAYVDALNAAASAADSTATSSGTTTTTESLDDYYYTTTGAITTDAGYPEGFVTAVAGLAPGQSAVVNLSDDGYLLLVEKHDINSTVDQFFNQQGESYDDNIFEVLVDMKADEYQTMMDDLVTNYDTSKLQYNSKNYNINLAELFGEETSTTSSSTSSAASTSSKVEESSAAASQSSTASTGSAA